MSGVDPLSAEVVKGIATAIQTAMDTPSKEIGNYIADKVRYLRYSSLLKILQKAEEKARVKGMHLKMPPIKFFVPFCESASLEDADTDESLAELWANILVDAQRYQDARHLLYLRVLKEITNKEADLLKKIVEESKATVYCKARSWRNCGGVDLLDSDLVELFIRELPSSFDETQIINAVINCMECPGLWFIFVTLFPADLEDMTDYYSYDDFEGEEKHKASVQVLESLGLVRRFNLPSVPVRGRPDVVLWCDGVHITELGISFYEAVTQKSYEKKFSRVVGDPVDHIGLHDKVPS